MNEKDINPVSEDDYKQRVDELVAARNKGENVTGDALALMDQLFLLMLNILSFDQQIEDGITEAIDTLAVMVSEDRQSESLEGQFLIL